MNNNVINVNITPKESFNIIKGVINGNNKMLATRPAIKAEMAKREEFSKKILKDIQNVCHKELY